MGNQENLMAIKYVKVELLGGKHKDNTLVLNHYMYKDGTEEYFNGFFPIGN